MTKTTVLLSGGLDSACCALMLVRAGHDVEGLYVNYGQLADNFESRASENVAASLSIPLRKIHISGGHTFENGEHPGRNAFLITAALLHTTTASRLIAIGIHSGSPYYDCSPPFFHSMNTVIAECSGGQAALIAPLLDWTKDDILDHLHLQRFEFSLTYSCENGAPGGCNNCHSCADRARLT